MNPAKTGWQNTKDSPNRNSSFRIGKITLVIFFSFQIKACIKTISTQVKGIMHPLFVLEIPTFQNESDSTLFVAVNQGKTG
jgi:hypothetical protein